MDSTKSKVFRVYEPPFSVKMVAHKHECYNIFPYIFNFIKIEFRRYEKLTSRVEERSLFL